MQNYNKYIIIHALSYRKFNQNYNEYISIFLDLNMLQLKLNLKN